MIAKLQMLLKIFMMKELWISDDKYLIELFCCYAKHYKLERNQARVVLGRWNLLQQLINVLLRNPEQASGV